MNQTPEIKGKSIFLTFHVRSLNKDDLTTAKGQSKQEIG